MRNVEKEVGDDVEICHARADDLLCELLTQLGFQKVVDEFNKITKWYA
jgi:hypothetical protein